MTKRVDKKTLGQIYRLMYNKLREIQIGNEFDKLIEERRKKTYKGKPDDWFFAQIVPCIFGGGLSGRTVIKRKDAIRKAFSDFKVDKVANYDEDDFNELMQNETIIRNPKKIRGCMKNAERIKKIAKEYGSFGEYVDHFIKENDVESLMRNLREKFSFIGPVLTYDVMKEWGIDCLKPSRDTVRIFSRLGLIDIEEDAYPDQQTIEEIQEIGKDIAEAVGERLGVVDAVIWLYSSGVRQYVKNAVCSHRKRKPLCEECGLYVAKICHWLKRKTTSSKS